MAIISSQGLNDIEKQRLISMLMPELAVLRTKAKISQDDFANIIGVSRQTYGAIERGVRKMSWNTYVSLIFYYDNNQKTHDFIRQTNLFPKDFINFINRMEGV